MPLRLEHELLQAVTDNDASQVRSLLAAGADPNSGLFESENALLIALRNGNEGIVDLIIQNGPLCCMRERHGDSPKPNDRTVWKVLLKMLLKGIAVHRAKMALTAYVCFKFGGLFAVHYLWFIVHYSSSSFHSTTSPRERLLDPWTYINALLSMAVWTRLFSCLYRHLFATSVLLGSLPSRKFDLIIALLLRVGVEIATFLIRATLKRLHLLKLPFLRWKGSENIDFRASGWVSPGEKILDSILQSASVTETMVLKLLRADMLVLRSYANSEVAHKLLQRALGRVWPDLVEFLLDEGVPVDHEVSPTSMELKWPAVSEALMYTFSTWQPGALKWYFSNSRPTLGWIQRYYPERSEQFGSFLQLFQNHNLLGKSHVDPEASLQGMRRIMDLLWERGADPNFGAGENHDVLSAVVARRYPKPLIKQMAQMWMEARTRKCQLYVAPHVKSLALHTALNRRMPDLGVVKILLDAGISLAWEKYGRTPFSTAAYMNENTDAMELLLEYGANLADGGSCGHHPICCTLDNCSYEKFKFFLDHGVGANAVVKDSKTILQVVLNLAIDPVILKRDLVLELLNRGARPDLRTPGHYRGTDEIIFDALLEKILASERRYQPENALSVASNDSSPRFPGTRKSSTSPRLLSRGRNLVARLKNRNPLSRVGGRLKEVEDRKYTDDTRRLSELERSDVNVTEKVSETALHDAVTRGYRDKVLLLLKCGADPNIPDSEGRTAIQRLCRSKSGVYDITSLREDADIMPPNAQYGGIRGQTGWNYERRTRRLQIKWSLIQEEIFQALVDHGSEINVVDDGELSLLMLASQTRKAVLMANILYHLGEEQVKEAINMTDAKGRSAFHYAAFGGNINTLKAIFAPQRVLDPVPNIWRRMAIDRVDFTIGASQRTEHDRVCLPNVSFSQWNLRKEEVSKLLPKNWQDALLRTPLHYAALNGHLEIAQMLLQLTNIAVNDEDIESKTAADLAVEHDFYDVYALLVSHGSKQC